MPVPQCVVTSMRVYMAGPPIIEVPATMQMAIYDCSDPVIANFTVVATSPTQGLTPGAAATWYNLATNIPLAAGTYGLAVLSNSAGTFTGSVFFTIKSVGNVLKNGITAGVFPSPLGITNLSNNNWSMYAVYDVVAGEYTPTAAHFCQPKCGD